jgi:uncharacterized Fe-S cluster-containing radical SAM superfamily protein
LQRVPGASIRVSGAAPEVARDHIREIG